VVTHRGVRGSATATVELPTRLAARTVEHFRKARAHLRRWNWPGFGDEIGRLEEMPQRLKDARP